jgi:hypothetical protein
MSDQTGGQNKELNEYIQKSLAQGHSRAAIRAQLLQYGWPQGPVDQALRSNDSRATGSAAKPIIAAQPLGPEKPKHKTHKSRKRKTAIRRTIFTTLIVLLCIAAIVVAGLLFRSSTFFKSFNNKTTQKNQSGLEQSAQDKARRGDVAVIISGIQQYITKNTGQLPISAAAGSTAHALNICGSSCNDATTLPVTLLFYKPSAVTFHPYVQSLVVPNTDTVYIVPSATCNQGALSQKNTSSVAVLYQLSSIGQLCATM